MSTLTAINQLTTALKDAGLDPAGSACTFAREVCAQLEAEVERAAGIACDLESANRETETAASQLVAAQQRAANAVKSERDLKTRMSTLTSMLLNDAALTFEEPDEDGDDGDPMWYRELVDAINVRIDRAVQLDRAIQGIQGISASPPPQQAPTETWVKSWTSTGTPPPSVGLGQNPIVQEALAQQSLSAGSDSLTSRKLHTLVNLHIELVKALIDL